jgi:hypothetical protein
MADIIPINTWFLFDFVSSVHRVPFNNVQLQVYIIKIKIVLYTQLSQLSHISLELLKHNIIAMCCHTMYLGKKFFFHIFAKEMRSRKNTTYTSRTCAEPCWFDWMTSAYYFFNSTLDNGWLCLATGTIPVSNDFPQTPYLWHRFFRVIALYFCQDYPITATT